MNILKRLRLNSKDFPTVHNIYTRPGVSRMSGTERTAMTVSCRDADYIPKVKDAGACHTLKNGTEVQVMHNGLIVERGGYYGDWMINIITALKGHHEPQEEKAFYEVLKHIKPGATMVELGSHWAFYSMWFHKDIKDAKNYCFEPDPGYLEGGKRNAKLNGVELIFTQAAAGKSGSPELTFEPETIPGKTIQVPILSVDEIILSQHLTKIDLLHMDIQGAELDALEGALGAIKEGKIRFVFVSTHHHSISGDPQTHIKCVKFFKEHGAHIIASHTIHESFSGDGLIVASFDSQDAGLTVDVSHNVGGNDLFIETEVDLAELARAYSALYDAIGDN